MSKVFPQLLFSFRCCSLLCSLPWKNLIAIWAFVSVRCAVALVTIGMAVFGKVGWIHSFRCVVAIFFFFFFFSFFLLDQGNVAFMMLDTRSHRSRNAAPDGPDKTLLGADQFQWALAWARNTQSARVRFILSPVPFSASVRRGDGWALFGREREALLEVLATHANTTTIFLSGDVHFAYSMRIRPNVFEVSASPISSFPLPSKLSLEAPEEVLFESQWKQHIGFVEVSSEVEDQVNVSLYGEIPGITTWLLDKRRINIS